MSIDAVSSSHSVGRLVRRDAAPPVRAARRNAIDTVSIGTPNDRDADRLPVGIDKLLRGLDREKEEIDRLALVADKLIGSRVAMKLRGCGDCLMARVDADGVARLVNPHFCNHADLCPRCIELRARRRLRQLLPTFRDLIKHPEIRAYSSTFTFHRCEDLYYGIGRVLSARSTLNARSRMGRRYDARNGALASLVGSIHLATSGNRDAHHRWHPHDHAILISEGELDPDALRREWRRLTGAHQVKVRLFDAYEDCDGLTSDDLYSHLLADFRRLFSYTLNQPLELDADDRCTAYRLIREHGRSPRLHTTYGSFYGPEKLPQEASGRAPSGGVAYRIRQIGSRHHAFREK